VEENQVTEKPKRSVLRKIGRFIFILFILIIVFLLSLLGLLFYYQNEVKAAIVAELNKHLKAEIKIDPKNIDLTIIKTFPDCSMEFKDMLMLEAVPGKNKDTLLFAGRLNLHFNIEDLWKKNYVIEKIKLKNGVVKLRVFKDGKNNYTFWEEDSKQTTNDSISFNLKLISIDNCRFLYRNRQQLFKTELNVRHIDFKGNFKQAEYELQSDGSIKIQSIAQAKTTFLKDKDLDYNISLNVEGNKYTFKQTDINLNKLALKLDGMFAYTDSLERLKLNFNAPELEIASLISLLPTRYTEKINDYKSSGNFYAKGKIDYDAKNFSLQTDFGISRGEITYKPTNTTAKEVNVEGKLRYSTTISSLELKNVHLNLNSDEINGSCLINDFSKPHITLAAKADVNLENLQNFWPIDTLTQLKGKLKIDSRIDGMIEDLKTKTFSKDVKLDLDASISDLQAQFKGDDKLYSIENCSVTALERHVEVKDLRLKRGSSDMTLNGNIPGMFNYILDRSEPLVINGTLFSNNLVLDDFIPKTQGSSTKNEDPLIPNNVRFKLSSDIRKFSFGKFEASAITGEIEVKNQKAIASDVKLQTLQGEAEIDVFADNSKKRLDVVLHSDLKNININELFVQMNNFGQTTLTDKNIKGIATATIEFSGSWNNNLEANEKDIEATCNLNIQRGELNNFEPLTKLSRFIDVQDLQRIKFSALQSNIQIRNSTITIPKTTIKNSALNVEVWGTHTFDNHIDYHIQLLISELLAKKRKKKDSEFGPIENDPENRRSAFILMTGTVDDPLIKYDKLGMKDKIKNDIKQEKQNIKQLLKEEFGLFKKDTLPKNKKSEQTFELEKEEVKPKKTLELKKKQDDEDF
jgi:hypothetical protein